MKRRFLLSVLAGSLFVFCFAFSVKGQSGQDEGVSGRLDRLEAMLDALQTQQSKAQTDIQAKLAQILANQQNILRELEIVKIRATRK